MRPLPPVLLDSLAHALEIGGAVAAPEGLPGQPRGQHGVPDKEPESGDGIVRRFQLEEQGFSGGENLEGAAARGLPEVDFLEVGLLRQKAVSIEVRVGEPAWHRFSDPARRLRRPQPALEESYLLLGRWGRRLGRPAGSGETASEFGRGLSQQVRAVDAAKGGPVADGVLEYVDRFEAAQYGPSHEDAAQEARRHWPRLERSLRRVWLRRRVGRSQSPSSK